jgi:hypothetical protein
VFRHFGKVAISGFAAASVLTAFAEFGTPGATAAANDLWEHAWLIHPFFYSLIGTAVSLAIVLQGARIAHILLDKVFSPLLDAMSHILAFSFGALVPLTAVNAAPWLTPSCEGVAAVVLVEFWIGLFAAMAIAGRFIVDDRQQISTGTRAKGATDRQLLSFLVLGVFFVVVAYECAHMAGKTNSVIEEYLVPVSKYACLLGRH